MQTNVPVATLKIKSAGDIWDGRGGLVVFRRQSLIRNLLRGPEPVSK